MTPLFIYLSVINSLAFLANGIDKWQAANQKQRISEKMLLGFAFVGGTLGAVIGMLLFRHKIAKGSYLLKFTGVAILQGIALYYYFNH
jgi:uncharacterized membrane protein YsdA (DUF1294 family)